MHKLSVFKTVFLALLLLSLATAGVTAAPPAQGGVETQAAVSTAFTYQGNLADGSNPANGSYDFEFTLFDAASGGSPAGLTQTKLNQTVTAGLFSVQLDFGNQFDGTALWLQINVRTAGDIINGYSPLSPRQPLTATPYAVTALNALNVPTHDHWGETWTGSGTGLTLSGGSTGLNATGTGIGMYGQTAGTGTNYAVRGDSSSTSGTGVYGWATATTGTTYGVYVTSASSSGNGVVGSAYATTGTTHGVYGVSASSGSEATGVFGEASATTGATRGVYAINRSTQGIGVYGLNTATTGATYGVYGQSNSPAGYGVYGSNTTTGGYAGYFNNTVRIAAGTHTFNLNSWGYLIDGPTPAGRDTGSATRPYSLIADGDIVAREVDAWGVYVSSDARIKDIQGRSDGAADLATLSQIEITDYTFKDAIANGSDPLKKVIGQQVEAVYPQAVKHVTDVVPDIYQKAAVIDGWVELATDLQAGERVRLIGEETEGIYEVLEVTPDAFRTDFVADGEAVFVFGREAQDFRKVDYEAISMLNVSATQEINRLVEQQAVEIEVLNTRLAALEQAANSVNTRSNSPLTPWLLLGGLGAAGLVFVQKRRAG